MKRRQVFILIPSLRPTGPIRGAVALCNNLVKHIPVTLVSLKTAEEGAIEIDDRVKVVGLDKANSWNKKRRLFRSLLNESGSRDENVSVSYCFSADFLNFFMPRHTIIISSVRGNLPKNYRFDYGWPGYILAAIHYFILRRFDTVISMSNRMAQQLRRFGIRRMKTIPNFIDESSLTRVKTTHTRDNDSIRFIFLASLSRRKRPELLVDAISVLRNKGLDCCLDLIGDGPMRQLLEKRIIELQLQSHVTLHGHQNDPYELLQAGDCMVLPSESEGIPRAAMEALFFGIPCILRDVDSNRDLVIQDQNGILFRRDEELADVMSIIVRNLLKEHSSSRKNLLPEPFWQEKNVTELLGLMQQ